MREPDWIYNDMSGGTYSMDGVDEGRELHSGPIPFDQPFTEFDYTAESFYVGASVLPIDSWLARKGVKGVRRQVTPTADVIAIVHTRWGPFGWFARRWIANNPLQLTVETWKPEWGEWREVIGEVRVL